MERVVNKVPLKAIVAMIGALLYGASPLDLIPDLIPVLGLVDDALVVPILLLFALFQVRANRSKRTIPIRVRR